MRPQVLDSVSAINNAIHSILDDLPMPSELKSGGNLVVGYDSEWNVDLSGLGHVVSRGPPAIVQIAYNDQIFILQVSVFWTVKYSDVQSPARPESRGLGPA